MTLKKLSLLSLIGLISPVNLLAQTSTPTSDVLRDSVKQKVAQEIAQIRQTIAKKGYIGNITSKTDVTVTITTPENQTRTLTVATDSTIKLKSGKDGTVTDLKTGDFILAMGDADAQNAMTVKRLLVVDLPTDDKRESLTGAVATTTSSGFTLAGSTTAYKVTSATKYTGKTKFTDVKAGSRIVAIVNGTSVTKLHLLNVTPTPATP